LSSTLEEVVIRPLQARDQAAARRLILDGLRQRCGELDETKNPDLDAIACYRRHGFRTVAVRDGDAHFVRDLEGRQRVNSL